MIFDLSKCTGEVWLKVSVKLAKDELYAKRGHEIAKEQFLVSAGKPIQALASKVAIQVFEDSEKSLTVGAKDFKVTFDKTSGYLTKYQFQGKDMLVGQLKPNFWRPITDNDIRAWEVLKNLSDWPSVTASLKLVQMKVLDEGLAKLIIADLKSDQGLNLQLSYKVSGDGIVEVNYQAKIGEKLTEPLRIGMTTGFAGDLGLMNFYGKGPYENYADRSQAAEVNIYSGKVEDCHIPICVTSGKWQSHRSSLAGSKKNATGSGLMVVGKQLLNASVWPYTTENIAKAKHINELEPAGFYTVNIDLGQAGLGGNDTWSWRGIPLPQYHLSKKEYSYGFKLIPFAKVRDVDGLVKVAGK